MCQVYLSSGYRSQKTRGRLGKEVLESKVKSMVFAPPGNKAFQTESDSDRRSLRLPVASCIMSNARWKPIGTKRDLGIRSECLELHIR